MRAPLFGLGIRSRSNSVTPAVLQNLYTETRPVGEKSQMVAYGVPGLDLFANAGDTPWRGLIQVAGESVFFGVHRGTLYRVNNAGTLTSEGTLNTSSGRVGMAHNGNVILIVDGTNGYTYTISTDTFTQIGSGTFLNGATTATWLDQYFIVEDGDQYALSDDGATWNSTDRGIPESSPDGIVRIVADHGELTIFGDQSTEFHTNTGATDFPFAPLKSSTAEWGCAARWSVAKANDSLTFLGKNGDGQASILRLKGYIPETISTPDLDYVINRYSTVSDATGFAYKLGGHPFYQINFPTAGASWLYDALSSRWTPVKSYGIGRQRGEIAIQFLGRTIVSDYSNGKLYTVNPDTYSENGETIEAELVSENIRSPDGERFPLDCIRLDMETGVGLATGQGSDPQVMLQVSRDGGRTWGSEMWKSAGKIGVYRNRVEWRRLGSTDQAAFRIRMSDPVKRTFISASLNPSD